MDNPRSSTKSSRMPSLPGPQLAPVLRWEEVPPTCRRELVLVLAGMLVRRLPGADRRTEGVGNE